MLVSVSARTTQQILLRSFQAGSHGSHNNGGSKIAARLFYSTCVRARGAAQRRPTVRGEAVAFHVKDLDHINRTRPLVHHAPAAALQYDDDYDYLDDEEDRPARQYDSDLIVVLDMDECLIHSQFLTNNPGAKFYAHQVARNSNSANEGASGRVDSFRFHLPDGDLVQVNKRPFLEDFLQAVTDKYETHIYTAAMKVYAEPILDKLDPNGDRFARRFYRESCDLDTNMGAFVKNLNSLPLKTKQNESNKTTTGLTYEEYIASTKNNTSADPHHHLRRVVLVDNNPLSFLANPTNGILVSSFYNDPADKTLPAVLDLLEELEPLEDVRPTLDARFGLKAALSEIQGNRRQQQQKKWTAGK
ncbi:Carboxy-terminal domain RNA polymerase II polypeptide A small phosphatase [Seminavis robusta]|uniref:Mitochondrial import inner membrane translocase subunit TIM50 n=1 Tax=Seminavis robusta TaxID=568900 RepID=A0A9N8DCY9_9STRA|nr:Carboxy-terminal domain RNA polymerase II polypeptide A small phosphatase [Seminavis robusta]|eukprot:Sro82_g044040.1 Carboxy-terminal domain RNA polymerase II polypeptide A small phosphatase (359) ;mRNA; f:98921-99997